MPPRFKHTNSLMIKQDNWIMDSRVTNLNSHSLSSFISTRLVKNYFVQLPNNGKTTIPHIGTIRLSLLLTFQNVLCVLVFKFNLVSVGELTKSKKTCTFFTDTHCII